MNIFEDIKVVCFDVDGTLTDGQYIVSSQGDLFKSFFTRDFHGMEMLLTEDISVTIISQSYDEVIQKKFDRSLYHTKNKNNIWQRSYSNMKFNIHSGCKNKRDIINTYLSVNNLSWDNVAYMGDAENDFECLKLASFSGCPADAIEEVREMVHYPSDFKGGEGAVYDFCKYILKNKDKNK